MKIKLGVAMAALGAATACSATEDEFVAEGLATSREAIAGSEWRAWGEYGSARTRTPLDTEPGVCGKGLMFNLVARNSSNRTFEVLSQVSHLWSGWNTFGSQQFYSSPACAMANPNPSSSDIALFIAGKGTDNHLFVTLGTSGKIEDTPSIHVSLPSQTYNGQNTGWGQLGNETYVGGTNGFPALASSATRVVLATRDNNTLYAYSRALPFSPSSPWTGRVAAPPLPFSAGDGTPAVAFAKGTTQAFVIFVKDNAGGLYYVLHTGSAFSGTWHRITLSRALNSDPTAEWTDTDGLLTIYYKDGTNKVVQTSAPTPSGLGTQVQDYINPGCPDCAFTGSPRAVSAAIEHGSRSVIIRGYSSVTPVDKRTSNIMATEEID